MKKTMKVLILIFVISISLNATSQAQVMYKSGDVVSLAGQQYTLDHFLNGEAIWKATNGNLYIVESAKRRDKENYIMTEVEISQDENKIINWKSAYKIGSKTPFNLDGPGELGQIAVFQKIEGGKLLKRKIYRTGSSGYPYPVTGLIYYEIGDRARFSGKELILNSFFKSKGLWKDGNDRSYVVTIASEKGLYHYIIKEVKP